MRMVSISGQKSAEVMFYWSKFGRRLKLIKNAKQIWPFLSKVWNYPLDGTTLSPLYTETKNW